MNACDVVDVSHHYRGRPALSHISFSLAEGRVTGLVGSNGSGKSTLLRMLAGVQQPTAGKIIQFGTDLASSEDAVPGIGASVDGMGLWPEWTVRRNLEYIAALASVEKQRIDSAMLDAQISHAARQRVRTLSLGNRQRVNLAVAILAGTRMILLDEPMNGLDPDARQHTRDLIVRLAAEGRTVVLSSHDLNDVDSLAGTVLVLRDGRLVYQGPTDGFGSSTRMAVLGMVGEPAIAQGILVQARIHCRRDPTGELVVFTHDAAAALQRLAEHSLPAMVLTERPATLEERFHSAY